MNKKIVIWSLGTIVLFMIIGIIYFTFSNKDIKKTLENQNQNKINQNSKSLVVYFSVPETDNPNNMTKDEDNSTVIVDGKVLGNTEYVASLISKKTNSDLFRLEPKIAYPTDHQQLLSRARDEIESNTRPELKEEVDINDYDTIFIGYPIWNAGLPPIINTFLENNNFKGKLVIPFCTHGGSGLSSTPQVIKKTLNGANVIINGFEIYRLDIEKAPNKVDEWLKELNRN